MERELTVLVYFGSDNPLAPLVVSQIKAIKDAGFQENTSVLVYFDPMEKGAPTQLYDVNSARKKKLKTMIGDGQDPYVRNMCEDKVDLKDFSEAKGSEIDPHTAPAVKSLENFINFALKNREAKNYMLFLVGHGMIVANDAFLPDEDPVSGITLEELKRLCGKFTKEGEQTPLQLLALHSCSMSSIEVAHQLKGQARYLLSSQGTVFVNGWPYRQLLKKTLFRVNKVKDDARTNAISENKTEAEVEAAVASAEVNYSELIRKLHFLCLFNFTDFMWAGYSCDFALCSLDPDRFKTVRERVQSLVSAMKVGLAPEVSIVKDLILLAHWEAQSFWTENYTDLWDFCQCLGKRCDAVADSIKATDPDHATAKTLQNISALCEAVREALAPKERENRRNGVVHQSDNFGSEFQYARGLSVYFPWSKPLDDQMLVDSTPADGEPAARKPISTKVLERYANYDFTRDYGDDSWLSFLEEYFRSTKRGQSTDKLAKLAEHFERQGFSQDEIDMGIKRARAAASAGILKRTAELKRTPEEGPDDCACPSIKNYPTRLDAFSLSKAALRAFMPPKATESKDVPEDDD
jgi:hypothetical protein